MTPTVQTASEYLVTHVYPTLEPVRAPLSCCLWCMPPHCKISWHVSRNVQWRRASAGVLCRVMLAKHLGEKRGNKSVQCTTSRV